jgi:hypothetical protein
LKKLVENIDDYDAVFIGYPQPEPGSRLLQAAVTSRKYVQRVRCMISLPTVAMLRSCAEALSSSASETTGNMARTLGWRSGVGHGHEGADPQSAA